MLIAACILRSLFLTLPVTMFKNRYIRFSVSSLLVVLALWVATPRVYIHELLNHNHSEQFDANGVQVKQQSADDCDFEKYNKPAYFNIFNFISGFIPTRPHQSVVVSNKRAMPPSQSYSISLLRAPPAKG
jgi:hypothetical protein